MSFERNNLAYIVRKTENKTAELLHILRSMPGSAIVYVRNRRRTKEITELLNNEDITADFYHAGLDDASKDIRQHRWQSGESRVMVATNAFGMGIDKPDVRIVIHMDLPDSIEAYFRKPGGPVATGKKPNAVILYRQIGQNHAAQTHTRHFSGERLYQRCVRASSILLPDGNGRRTGMCTGIQHRGFLP